jgi:ribonuclease G
MLNKLIVVRQAELVYSLAYVKDKLVFATEELFDTASEAVYVGKISKLNQRNRTAFIEYLPGQSGFVNLSPQDVLQEGSLLAVQMAWQGNESKQPKFRTSWQLVGKYLVYTPVASRKLNLFGLSAELAAKLELLLSGYAGSWVIRSSVQYLQDYSLVASEAEQLFAQATRIKTSVVSGECYAGVPNYLKILRSLKLSPECEVISNDGEINQQLLHYQDLWQIDAISYDPAGDYSQLIADYRALCQEPLYSVENGANLEIHTVAGINLIDINAGRLMLAHDKLNFSVLDEIYRQICIRNLQGIILLDLVKNLSAASEQKILDYLRKLFKIDLTNTAVLGFSHSGLCELIRNKF